MKTIKITIATYVVALSSLLIWTACQKEQTPVNNIDETINGKSANKKSKNYVFEAYSNELDINIKASVIDNGNGTVVINSKITDEILNNRGNVFVINTKDFIFHQDSISIPENSKYWTVNIFKDGSLLGVKNNGSFIFKCYCNDTNSESPACPVVEISPQPDVLVKDCTNKDSSQCTRGCRGVLIRTKPVKTKSNINTSENEFVGKILVKADKLVLNGKIYK
jgi:hypothetical protein